MKIVVYFVGGNKDEYECKGNAEEHAAQIIQNGYHTVDKKNWYPASQIQKVKIT